MFNTGLPNKAPERTANRAGGAGGMQNVGNSIGDVPSVRLYAPPGGGSSFTAAGGATMAMLGGGPDPAPTAYQTSSSAAPIDAEGPIRTASRGVGAGGMQNVGNSIGEIPSVKLHAPPGGASQVMFG